MGHDRRRGCCDPHSVPDFGQVGLLRIRPEPMKTTRELSDAAVREQLERETRPPPRRRRLPPRHLALRIITYAALIILSGFVLLPALWMLTAALKPDFAPIFTLPPQWFPTKYWDWSNFLHIMNGSLFPFARYVLNTCIILVGNLL